MEGDPITRQSLKAAIWYTVTKLVEEEEISVGISASEHFTAVLAEMVFQQLLTLGKDLESFMKHANRTTINVDDVKLACRRNEPLYEQLSTEAVRHGLALSDLKPKAKPRAKLVAPRATTSKAKALSVEADDAGEEEDDDEPPRKKPRPTKTLPQGKKG